MDDLVEEDVLSSKNLHLRITINQDGTKRGLLTIAEDDSGDVIFATRAHSYVENFDELDFKSSPSSTLVKNQKFNVHLSKKSPYAHTIKHYIETKDKWTDSYVQSTAAIKRDNCLALVYVRRCPAMTEETSEIIDDNTPEVSLGFYQPMGFTLFFSVFVGPRDYDLKLPDALDDMQVKQINTRELSIFIFWSFLTSMAPPAGTIIGKQTNPESKDANGQRVENRTSGLNTIEALDEFRKYRVYLWYIMGAVIKKRNDHPLGTKEGLFMHTIAKFYKHGRNTKDLYYVGSDKKYKTTMENSPFMLFNDIKSQSI